MAQTLGDSGTGGMRLPTKRGQYGIKTDGKKGTFTRGVNAPGPKAHGSKTGRSVAKGVSDARAQDKITKPYPKKKKAAKKR